MRIERMDIETTHVPLKRSFITALRVVNEAHFIILRLHGDDGSIGYGSAPPTAAITGETLSSIEDALRQHIGPAILGMDIGELDAILDRIDGAMPRNTSAKAAADMAVHDLFGKFFGFPLARYFGGATDSVETDITVSLRSPNEMGEEALEYQKRGYTAIKVKVGRDSLLDIERIRRVRAQIGPAVRLRIDANQGWKPKEAVRTIRALEDAGFNPEWVEQPVQAQDVEGLRFVTEHVGTPIMADEALFSPEDAFRLLEARAADLFNIKLMKCGGLRNARTIHAMAKARGIDCMVGCMIESRIGITAAAHFACGQTGILAADLDAIDLIQPEIFEGGVSLTGNRVVLPDGNGLGIG